MFPLFISIASFTLIKGEEGSSFNKCIMVLAWFSSQAARNSITICSLQRKPQEMLWVFNNPAGCDFVRKDPSAVLNLDPTQDNTKIHNQIRVQSKTNGTKTLRTHCEATVCYMRETWEGINTQEKMIKKVISECYTWHWHILQ